MSSTDLQAPTSPRARRPSSPVASTAASVRSRGSRTSWSRPRAARRSPTPTGRVYTDYHAAFGPPLLGHNDPDVEAAVAATGALARPDGRRRHARSRSSSPSASSRTSRRSRRCCSPATGSEATFHALRVSRAATGRRHVIKFQGCYHGWHDSVAMNVISPAERVGSQGSALEGDAPRGRSTRRSSAASTTRTTSRARSTEHDVAAIILELIPHNIGAVLPQPGFLERLRELATKHGTVLDLRRGDHRLPARARRLPGRSPA